jgi:multiple sugar transport system permease protein
MIRELDSPGRLLPPEPTQNEVEEGFTRWVSDLSRFSHYVLTIGAVVLFLLPLFWMFTASLRERGLPPPRQIELFPSPAVLSNYPIVMGLLPMGDYLMNSLKVVALAVPITILTASWAGFAMAQLGPRVRNWLFAISLATMMVPVTAIWIPRFIVYKWLNVLDSLGALVMPSIMGTSPFYVLIFYWAFRRIPAELYEAARLEGAGAFRIWALIGMPLARAAITAVGVLSFVLYWSNFMDPLLYLSSQDNYTLPVGLQALKQMLPTDFPVMMAGSVLITLPVIIMFLLAQRYFFEETRGAGWLGR